MPELLPDLMTLSRYDDDLRQVAADTPALEAAIATARLRLASLPTDDGPDAARLESYIGEALRIMGRNDEALACHRSAIDRIAGTGHRRAQLTYALRLAETQRVSGDLVAAERGFKDGLAAARRDPELAPWEDFALQHLGKCRLDQGRFDEAEAALRAALAIRRRKGDATLIASTEAALTLVTRRQTNRTCS